MNEYSLITWKWIKWMYRMWLIAVILVTGNGRSLPLGTPKTKNRVGKTSWKTLYYGCSYQITDPDPWIAERSLRWCLIQPGSQSSSINYSEKVVPFLTGATFFFISRFLLIKMAGSANCCCWLQTTCKSSLMPCPPSAATSTHRRHFSPFSIFFQIPCKILIPLLIFVSKRECNFQVRPNQHIMNTFRQPYPGISRQFTHLYYCKSPFLPAPPHFFSGNYLSI